MVVLLQGSRHCASCIYVSAHDFIDAPAEVMCVLELTSMKGHELTIQNQQSLDHPRRAVKGI